MIDDSTQLQGFCATLLDRIQSCGIIQDLLVLSNQAPHLRGTVYMRLASAEDATAAIAALQDESAGPSIYAEPCAIDFREARCKVFEEGQCTRGAFCNFLHVRELPPSIQRRLGSTRSLPPSCSAAPEPPTTDCRAAFDSLADVEIRLIMHNLSLIDRLLFARSAHRTLHAADHSHAWEHSDWRVHSDQLALSLDCPVGLSRLLRHCKMSLTLAEPGGVKFHERLVRSLAADQVVSLDLSACSRLSYADLLELPAVQSVQRFVMHNVLRCPWPGALSANLDAVKAMMKLQKLHTLSIYIPRAESALEEEVWRGLSAMLSLTSLTVMPDLRGAAPLEQLQYVAACPHLRHLHLCGPRLSGDRFLRFFSGSPALRTLQTLTLDETSRRHSSLVRDEDPSTIAPVPVADLIAGLNCLPLLYSLKLIAIQASGGFLSALLHVPFVSRVLVVSHFARWTCGEDLPSREEVTLLLSGRPSLHLSFVLWNGVHPQNVARWQSRQKALDEFAELFSQLPLNPPARARLHVRCADSDVAPSDFPDD